jgi:hypothetical protein
MKKQKIPIPKEEHEQYTFVQWLEYKRISFIHVPNGGKRNYVTGARLKAQGVKAGFPDIIVFDIPPKLPTCRGVAIEMKRRSGSKTLTEQKIWIEKLIGNGWFAEVCEGAEKAIKVMTELGF